MPALANPRWERFAQELANGQPATRAYVLAGYHSNSGNAATLKAQQSVSKRVKELLAHREAIEARGIARAIEQRGINRGDVLAMLIDDHNLAREKGQIGAAIRAAELLGKELGMFIDHKRFEILPLEQRLAQMTDEQRMEEAKQLAARIRRRLDEDIAKNGPIIEGEMTDVTPEGLEIEE